MMNLNGVQEASQGKTGEVTDSSSPLRIRKVGDSSQTMSSLVDEFRVYNRALSAAEIQDIMNSPYAGSPPTNSAPTANAGPDRIVTDVDRSGSESVTLDGTGSVDPDGTITSYVWREIVLEVGNGPNPTVSLTAGTHPITLTVTDDDGATGTDSMVVTVNHRPVASFPAPTTSGLTVDVDGSGSSDGDGDALTFDWNWGDGTSHSSSAQASHSYSCDGTILVTLTTLDGRGGTDSLPRTVIVTDTDSDADGLGNCKETQIGTSPSVPDTDGDGLSDGVEWTASTTIFGSWASTCDKNVMANRVTTECPHPLVRDVFVEIDWMAKPTFHLHDHQLPASVLTTLKSRFSAHDIRLHVDQGGLGGGNEIAHDDVFDSGQTTTTDDADRYYNNDDNDGFTPGRHGLFRYGLMAHYNEDECPVSGDGSVGFGEVPQDPSFPDGGDMFVVFRGCIDRYTLPWESEDNNVINLFLQELGHNIFGFIEPPADRDTGAGHGGGVHDIFSTNAMWWRMNGSTDYHPRRWTCVAGDDQNCDIDDLGEGLFGKGDNRRFNKGTGSLVPLQVPT